MTIGEVYKQHDRERYIVVIGYSRVRSCFPDGRPIPHGQVRRIESGVLAQRFDRIGSNNSSR